MFWFWVIIIKTICGGIAAAIASHKGRSVVGWFIGGFLIELIGIIIVACLPNLREQRAYREFAERDRHRLREQLRQERLKGEAFRRYSTARLDTHDRALGTDTRSAQSLPSAESALHALSDGEPPTAAPPGAQPAAGQPAAAWYYEVSGAAKGPVSAQTIKELLQAKAIAGTTLLWSEDLGDWTPASQVPLFGPSVSS